MLKTPTKESFAPGSETLVQHDFHICPGVNQILRLYAMMSNTS